jgi:hypothetical protein
MSRVFITSRYRNLVDIWEGLYNVIELRRRSWQYSTVDMLTLFADSVKIDIGSSPNTPPRI